MSVAPIEVEPERSPWITLRLFGDTGALAFVDGDELVRIEGTRAEVGGALVGRLLALESGRRGRVASPPR